MEDLPAELKINISSFLAAKDTCYFAQASKHIHEDIDIGLLVHPGSKIGLLDKSWYGATHGIRPYVWASIPLILEKNTHSVIFSCKWMDHGWGSQYVGVVHNVLKVLYFQNISIFKVSHFHVNR